MTTGLAGNVHLGKRLLARLALALLLWLAVTAAQAAAYNFTGGNIAGCARNGTIYTCDSLPLSEWNDSMTIGDSYTVNVNSDVGFSYNQTLKMSGTARLTSKGALHIADIAPANLQISGGFLVAAAAFNVGNQNQTLTANITGGSLYIGNGSSLTINGSLTSSGVINIASHTTINGSINGRDVYTNSPVKITGNVSAGSSFTLASGSTMIGNISASTVRILASSVTVMGNIQATTSLTLESGNKIIGDVTTGTLTLTDSAATVEGNATVDKAILGWAGRVTKLITCRSGNTVGNCDCVVNNSGYAVNTANGPRCTAAAPAAPHHILVVHSGTGFSCAPMDVTVYACNNAACTVPHFTAKHTVTLYPGGQKVDIVNGVAASTISSAAASDTIKVTSTATNALDCRYQQNGTWVNSCAVKFDPSGFALTAFNVDSKAVPEVLVAEQSRHALRIAALKQPANPQSACVPAFQNVARQVRLSCQYDNPASGSKAVRLANAALNAGGNKDNQCDAGGAELTLNFDNDGIATADLMYADAGKIKLNAEIAALGMKGSGDFLYVPAAFTFSNVPSAERVAGIDMVDTSVGISAVNAVGELTANFSSAEPVMAADVCLPEGGDPSVVSANPVAFAGGKTSFSNFIWPESGLIRMKASVTQYQGKTVAINGYSALNCTSDPGRVTVRPDHLHVARTPVRPFHYSGEPFRVTVTAHNAGHATTRNFTGATGARNVTLGVFAGGATTANPGPGAIVAAQGSAIAASRFTAGASEARDLAYRFNAIRTAPARVWVGATANGIGLQPALPEIEQFNVRSGRLRLTNRAGFMNTALVMPINAEYWTGGSWLLNADDNFTRIPLSAIARTPDIALDGADFTLTGGRGAITLRAPGQRTSVDVAINLGPAVTSRDVACLADHPFTVGANLPWLRSLYGSCASGDNSDPSARATFGIFSAETRRIIHVRESFR